MTRSDVLSQAVDQCLKEIYSYVQPHVKWEDFMEENKIYSNLYKEWKNFVNCFTDKENHPKEWEEIREKYKNLEWENKSVEECIGPRPFEFYHIPKDILKDICDSYIYAYKIDEQQNLLDIIQILKNYCKEPIVDKYIDEYTDEYGNRHPGHRGYNHPDDLIEEVRKILIKYDDHMDSEISEEVVNKFFSFLDMAGEFYNWNRDLNSFNMSIYLGPSPNTNKETVIKNWKKYKNKDIEINEEQIKINYYGEDYDG